MKAAPPNVKKAMIDLVADFSKKAEALAGVAKGLISPIGQDETGRPPDPRLAIKVSKINWLKSCWYT